MILNFLSFLLFISSISCLRWTPSNVNASESPISLQLSQGVFPVDIYKGDQIIIDRDISKTTHEFMIYCMVSGLTPKSDMIYKFCKDENCLLMWKGSEIGTQSDTFNYKIIRISNPSNTNGLILKLQFPGPSVDASGNFHCQAHDQVGQFVIRSNDIQIRDTLFWSRNYVENPGNTKKKDTPQVKRDIMPITFKCLDSPSSMNQNIPSWFNQLSISPVQWSVCPVRNNFETLQTGGKVTFDNCIKYTTQRSDIDEDITPRTLSKMDEWITYIDTNGDLQIFQINTDKSTPVQTYALMCYIMNNQDKAAPIKTYYKEDEVDYIKSGVEFLGQPKVFENKLASMSLTTQNISLYSRKMGPLISKGHTPRPVALFALYRASSNPTYIWKFNGVPLSSGNHLKLNEHSVQFIGDITSYDAGTYTLEITDKTEKLTMTIHAIVLGSPTLVNPDCLPLVHYVHEYHGTSFTCTYRNMPEKLILKINNVEIALGQSWEVSRLNLGKSYPFLGELNFTGSPVGYSSSETVTMTYSIFNLRMTQGQTLYQDHNVMFFVQNKYGLSVKSTSIYVVPRLKDNIESSPEAYNCTNACSSLFEHKFQCKINIEKYNNRELIIKHYWTINNHDLENINDPNNIFAKYFKVDKNTRELTLIPINSNNTQADTLIKNALKDNNIECRFELFSPPEVIPQFIYESKTDLSLGTLMKARITLDNVPINTAYIYWIVAVILALIIILLMIVLLTRYCMRNKGETYQLDKIERQHGYDPEKEVQEEMFKPYEREEHDPDVMSGGTGDRKLSITGHSVGSADDGELDNYDLDPSNFNEDGSIIGKYGANPRSRAEMT